MSAAPKLSIIIGAIGVPASLAACLAAIERQRRAGEVEVIVVADAAAAVGELAGDVRLVRAAGPRLMPELWEIGINDSAGEIVALTTAHFVPRGDWVAQILKAHAAPHPAIGGAIENSAAAGLADWAVYFCRYSQFMLPFPAAAARDLAGDNAAYKRRALERYREERRAGFWEPLIHAAMMRDGYELRLTPEIVVEHQSSFGVAEFIRQRFWHGRQFGSGRATVMPAWRRLVYLLLSPLIPAALLWRIARRVLARRRHAGKLLLASPILFLFLLGWAAGEASGYLRPRRRGQPDA